MYGIWTRLVALVYQIDSIFRLVLTEQVYILILIACRDKPLQSQKLKVIGKVSEEVADARIIAIAQYCFASEMLPIVPQFVIDVLQLRIEFIFLCCFRCIQILVCHLLCVFDFQLWAQSYSILMSICRK